LEAARLLEAQGESFDSIVGLLQRQLDMSPIRARAIAAEVCKPKPRRKKGQVHVSFPTIDSSETDTAEH
jgi:hypothetical protein